jgi:broad specificity phosphatase PhoE
MNKIYVVRHSERLDEVDLNTWLELAERERLSDSNIRNHNDYINDPPITQNGKDIAREASLSLLRYDNITDINVIYCSILRRCVETACIIAQQLQIPICVSKGLALTAIAVRKREMKFDFIRFEKLSELYPGVSFIDGDDKNDEVHYVESNSWDDSVKSVASKGSVNLIIAHRETIRDLAGVRYRLPYCGIGTFDYDPQTCNFNLVTLHDCHGNDILNSCKVIP